MNDSRPMPPHGPFGEVNLPFDFLGALIIGFLILLGLVAFAALIYWLKKKKQNKKQVQEIPSDAQIAQKLRKFPITFDQRIELFQLCSSLLRQCLAKRWRRDVDSMTMAEIIATNKRLQSGLREIEILQEIESLRYQRNLEDIGQLNNFKDRTLRIYENFNV